MATYQPRGLQPYGPDIQGLIRSAAAKYRIPEALLSALVEVESNGNPNARSPKGAMGLAQLMPKTAAALGVTNPMDPAQNLDGAARHLSTLLTKYRGSVSLALAAYNAGEPAVDSVKGVPNYPETIRYIQKVAAVMNKTGGTGVDTPKPPATPYSNSMTRPVPTRPPVSVPQDQYYPEQGVAANEPPMTQSYSPIAPPGPPSGIGGGVRDQSMSDLMDQLVYSAYGEAKGGGGGGGASAGAGFGVDDSAGGSAGVGGGGGVSGGPSPDPEAGSAPAIASQISPMTPMSVYGSMPRPGLGGLSRFFRPSGGRTFTDYTPSDR